MAHLEQGSAQEQEAYIAHLATIMRHMGAAQRRLAGLVEPDVVASQYRYASWVTFLCLLRKRWTPAASARRAATVSYLQALCRSGWSDRLRANAKGCAKGLMPIDKAGLPRRVPMSAVQAVGRGDNPYQRAAWGEIFRLLLASESGPGKTVLLAIASGEKPGKAAKIAGVTRETVRRIRLRALAAFLQLTQS